MAFDQEKIELESIKSLEDKKVLSIVFELSDGRVVSFEDPLVVAILKDIMVRAAKKADSAS